MIKIDICVKGVDFGYLGKPYDSATGLYNYGYRDYSPTAARFTTVDPIKDGSNWFVYVNNDPVNYVDLWGLEYLGITSFQQQNVGNNKDASIGSIPSYNNKSNGEKPNTVGNFGCLITCAVNVGNSYNMANNPSGYQQQSVVDVAGNDDYYTYSSVSRVGGTPTDFNTSPWSDTIKVQCLNCRKSKENGNEKVRSKFQGRGFEALGRHWNQESLRAA